MTDHIDTMISLSAAAASWGVRWNTYVFLRMLPFASRFMPRIWTCLAISVASIIVILCRQRASKGTQMSRTRSQAVGWIGRVIAGSARADSPSTTMVNLMLNIMSAALCLDFIYRAHYLLPSDELEYVRVGYVTHDTAALSLRSTSGDAFLRYWVEDGPVREASIGSASAAGDYMASIHLDGLQAGQRYHYNTTSGLEGEFVTRAAPTDMKSFSILSTSCQKPNWPYSPVHHPLRLQGLEHVDRYLAGSKRTPEMMLFLGDFIYSDLPMPVAPYTLPYYRELYRQIYASPSWTPRLRSIPWVHMFDDHEIINDFAPSSQLSALYTPAMRAYNEYQAASNPPALVAEQPTYTSFNIGQVSFFVLDNRSFRDPQPLRPNANSSMGAGKRSMLGVRQMLELKKWVKSEGHEQGRLLVLVSGVPVTRNWSEGKDEFDSWAGYLDERKEILNLLWGVGGAIIISGDRHEHATTLFPPPLSSPYPSSSAVIEFSTSPLSFFHQPWLREHVPHPPTDITLHHQWRGMSRFGVFDFSADDEVQRVTFKLIVDGVQDWEYTWVKGGTPACTRIEQ